MLRYFNPWTYHRQRQAERVRALRARDGDACARCRRPMRFDLPAGHDQGAAVLHVGPGADDVRLAHGRCNPFGVNHTDEVLYRARLKNEAALFTRSKASRAA